MADPKDMFQCQISNCGYIYDPERGDRKGKVPKKTKMKELPEEWKCPVCGARPKTFKCLG